MKRLIILISMVLAFTFAAKAQPRHDVFFASSNLINRSVSDSNPTRDTYDFDDGTLMGWTSIDADGDGHGFMNTKDMSWGVFGEGHNGSPYYALSQSYTPQTGQTGPLTPDNFLVSPEKKAYTNIKFWACGHDNNYAAEHFGVAVSTTGNTAASDFTTIQEWTLTAKAPAASKPAIRGTREQGNWYEYTVDLSAYAGQEIWVAIRHFDCTNQYFLDIDDITLAIQPESIVENNPNTLSVYPNPATDRVVFTSAARVNEYRIYNMAGTEVMSGSVNAETFEVNVSNMPTGVYVVRIYGEGIVQSKKFMIK